MRTLYLITTGLWFMMSVQVFKFYIATNMFNKFDVL